MNLTRSLLFPALLFFCFAFAQTGEPDITALRALYSSGDARNWPRPFLEESVKPGFQDIGSLPKMAYPEDNPYSEAKRKLGKMLFFDPRLSRSGQIACASCHDPDLGWGDGRRVSFGHSRRAGKRNAMTLLNVGHAADLFWDGRSVSLEHQVSFPIQDTLEMNFHIDLAAERIRKIPGYRPYFQEAFQDSLVTQEKIRKAIATFERTIVSRKTRFDRFIQGDADTYTDEEVLGLHLFRTKARCINCHNTSYFSDNRFHNTGLHYYGRFFEDLGYYHVTGKKEDVGKFRTATLREIAQTGPYMHNGLFEELRGIIILYNAGMPHPSPRASQQDDPLYPTTSPLLKKLDLTEKEQEALIAFLKTLSSTIYSERPPALPEL